MHAITNKIGLLLLLVSMALAGLSGWKVLGYVEGKNFPERKKDLFKNPLPSTKHHATGKVSLDDYVTVRPDRFCGYTPSGKPIQKTEGSGKEAVYVLKGVTIHSNPALSSAFIEIPGVEKQAAYYPGDDVHGASLVRIAPEFVELEVDGELRKIEMVEETGISDLSSNRNIPQGATPAEIDKKIDQLLVQVPREMRGKLKMLIQSAPMEQKMEFLNLPPGERKKKIREFIKSLKKNGKKR